MPKHFLTSKGLPKIKKVKVSVKRITKKKK